MIGINIAAINAKTEHILGRSLALYVTHELDQRRPIERVLADLQDSGLLHVGHEDHGVTVAGFGVMETRNGIGAALHAWVNTTLGPDRPPERPTLPAGAAFWMVARQPTSKASKTEPKARFYSLQSAQDSARAFANRHTAPFVVLAVQTVIHPGDRAGQKTLF